MVARTTGWVSYAAGTTGAGRALQLRQVALAYATLNVAEFRDRVLLPPAWRVPKQLLLPLPVSGLEPVLGVIMGRDPARAHHVANGVITPFRILAREAGWPGAAARHGKRRDRIPDRHDSFHEAARRWPALALRPLSCFEPMVSLVAIG